MILKFFVQQSYESRLKKITGKNLIFLETQVDLFLSLYVLRGNIREYSMQNYNYHQNSKSQNESISYITKYDITYHITNHTT